MRLMQPNPGECVDRQTILQLKIKHGAERGMNTLQFMNEHEQIQKYLQDNFFLLVKQKKNIEENFDGLLHRLLTINSSLWECEDKVREFKAIHRDIDGLTLEQARQILYTYYTITQTNDERAKLVKDINKLFGISSVEKLHEGVVA